MMLIPTNHLERALRVIPMGRKNWMFCWTEVGAQQVGMIQSLLTTCVLHDVDPYTCLVDVLQRIDQHPQSKVAQLTPRLWKEHFADRPMRSMLDGVPR
jgi:transposase